MCGRFVSPSQAAIERAWQIARREPAVFRPSFNVAPTAQVAMLVAGADGELELRSARWGMIPAWWKKDKLPTSTFNARVEEAAVKPMWRHAYVQSRCLVPAQGWYEWQAGAALDPATGELRAVRQPIHLCRPGGGVFAFAGLWATWRAAPDAAPQVSCAILTRGASGAPAEVHDRMPVVLRGAAERAWLDPAQRDRTALDALVARHADAHFEFYPVSLRVNRPQNDDATLVQRLEPPA